MDLFFSFVRRAAESAFPQRFEPSGQLGIVSWRLLKTVPVRQARLRSLDDIP
jgi:hypothetical protein